MRETKKCYRIEAQKYLCPELRFELIDGPTMIHEIHENLIRGSGVIEIELTIRYVRDDEK